MNYIYMSITLEKRALTIEEAISVVRGQYSSTEEVPVEKELVIRLSTTDIAILSFVICAVLSLISALVYKAFFAEPQHIEAVSKTNNNRSYTNMEFAEKSSDEGFDYPYEDIGDALK